MDNTFGRQVLALDYVGSNFTFTSPSILSPNVILSADKEDNASNVYNYEISHEVNENNYATKIRTSGSFEYNEITEFTFE